MSAKFFSQRNVGHVAPLEVLEHQQALLLSALRRADGVPTSYAELRDAGVEFPASVVSELELAGVAIERCYQDAHGRRRLVGVRLDPSHAGGDGSLGALTDLGARESEARARRSSAANGMRRPAGGSHSAGDIVVGRWRLPAAMGLAAGIAIALVIAGLAGAGGRATGTRAHRRAGRGSLIAQASIRTSASARSDRSRPVQTLPTPVSGALATQLEARGHGLLQTGQYGEAIPVLRRALAATGERLGGCLQPTSEQCLTYAYALYDLGRALLLSGSTRSALAVLEQRLQIENQRPAVAAELESARRLLG